MSKPKKAVKSAFKAAVAPIEKVAIDPIRKGLEGVGDTLTPDVNMPDIDIPGEAPSADLSGSIAAEEQRRRQARSKGRASTILTSSQGAAGTAGVGTKTLLGS